MALAPWPPSGLAGRLIEARSGLGCYVPGSARCRECHFAMELPLALALARASDAAGRDGDADAARRLIDSAFAAAGLPGRSGGAAGGVHAGGR
jgi:hypothetical protein